MSFKILSKGIGKDFIITMKTAVNRIQPKTAAITATRVWLKMPVTVVEMANVLIHAAMAILTMANDAVQMLKMPQSHTIAAIPAALNAILATNPLMVTA